MAENLPTPPGSGPPAKTARREAPPGPPRRLTTTAGTLVVVASMVGTGIFTTTGFLVRDLGSAPAVLAAWALGGAMALSGALAYAELCVAFPDNGGEYQLLSRVYRPALGFLAGWVSLVVGFSAPMAAAALAFGQYASAALPSFEPTVSAIGLIGVSSLLHAVRVSWGVRAQNAVTALDVALIALFVAAGAMAAPALSLPRGPRPTAEAMASPELAVGLVYVAFSYSGWNAASYLVGELSEPARSLPRSLVRGTAIVTVLYLGITFVFLIAAPLEALSGVVDVGNVAAEHLFGPDVARAFGLLVALGLATSVSALVATGSRVYEAMGRDYPRLGRVLSRGRSDRRGPVAAIALQTALAAAMVLTSSFEPLLSYVGFTLSAFTGLTIFGVFVLRRREPGRATYRAWGHPFTTGTALLVTGWMLVHTIAARPAVVIAGGVTLLAGYVAFRWASQPLDPRR